VESFPGVASFLKAVKESGILIALATSAPPENINLIMERLPLRPYFDFILDSTDVSKGKPNPEIYHSSVKKLGFEKRQCIVFEDSKAGIQSARGAGLKVVGVTSSHTREELLEEGVDMAIDNFNELTIEKITNLLQ
jgi:HAD superfamily hydrolase (TIGR01509 family)